MSDPTIERIEAELRESQFKPWDAETFLAGRHQAKIDALSEPESRIGRLWTVIRELAVMLFAYLGFAAMCLALVMWLLTGRLPYEQTERVVILPPAPPALLSY